MILKWIGAILVVACCGGFGMATAARYRTEEKTLKTLERALLEMSSELQYRLTSLPLLCKMASSNCDGLLAKVFKDFSEELETQIAPDASLCMGAVLNRYPQLPPISAELLRQFGNMAGRFDLQGQLSGIAHLQNLCAHNLQQLSANRDTRLRNYQALGLCAGAALVILFI